MICDEHIDLTRGCVLRGPDGHRSVRRPVIYSPGTYDTVFAYVP